LDAARRLGDGRVKIAGGGPLEVELRKRVRDEALPVDLLGHLSPDALATELRRAYAVVLPSIWYENCPMSLLEAAAAGVPCVATELGGSIELIEHERTGLLVPPADARALADALNSLARDPDAVRSAGRHAWERARAKHNARNHLEALVEIYEDARVQTFRVSA
jgi:glycosyltransferase involved in cell wall biosynthesis